MRYVVYGAGAVGGVIGGNLHGAGVPTTLVARGAHLEAIRRDGLLLETAKKIYLITDRLSAHDCAAVWDWVDGHADRIDLFLLPRYSPERNPDEYLNNDLKGRVNAAGLPHSKGEVRSRIQGFMRQLLHLPEHVMNYFCHPSVQYAAAIN